MSSSHTRRWHVVNANEQIRAANKVLSTRLMQIVTQRNLNVHLATDTPSISELVDVLATNKVIPGEEEKNQGNMPTQSQEWVIRWTGERELPQMNFSRDLILLQ
jgi:hypothetical protein